VTSTELLDACITACFKKYPQLEMLTLGDVPLQSCDWDVLSRQAGFSRLIEKFGGKIEILDLRRERFRSVDGYLERDPQHAGDPLGYAEIVLDEKSQLDEVSHNAASFRVSDYDPQETISVHRKGSHRYLIARSVLMADLVINFPKMKTHQKSGITGALKNLVGINGSKAYLVHHQLGKPSRGGDEFPEDISMWFYWQARLREMFQKRSRFVFKLLKRGWEMVKRLKGIKTVGTRDALRGNFYVGSGSWYGNDSIWRMVYDLNVILLFGKQEGGELSHETQRTVMNFLDGVIAGEGNGPLQPLPVNMRLLAASRNPFLIDFAMARMMGYDWRKIRLLSHYRGFAAEILKDFDPDRFTAVFNGIASEQGVNALPVLHRFSAPPGWRGHIEAE